MPYNYLRVHKKSFILLLYLIFSTSNLNAGTFGSHEFGVKLLGFYEYDEPSGFMHLRAGVGEKDDRPKAGYGLTYTFNKSFILNDLLTEFEFDNSFKKYEQDYWSAATGILKGTDVEIYNTRLLYGISASDKMMFKSGFGYRHLYHFWQNMFSTTNNWGYDREQEYYYIPFIAELKMPIPEINLNGTLKVEFDHIFNGNLTSYAAYQGEEDRGSHNDDGYIWKVSYKVTNDNNISFEPYYLFMSVEESEIGIFPSTSWQEPSNLTKEYGLNIKKAFGDRGMTSEDNHKRILEDDKYYFGIEALYTEVDIGYSQLTGTSKIDEKDRGYSIITGMKILEEPKFGLNARVAFNQFGKARFGCNTNDTFVTDGKLYHGRFAPGTTITCNVDNLDHTVETYSTTIGILPYYNLGNFYLNANAGFNRWDQAFLEHGKGVSNLSYDYTGIDFYHGFGLGANIGNFTFELAKLNYNMHYDAESLNAAIKYNF